MSCVLGVTRVNGFLWAQVQGYRDDRQDTDVPETGWFGEELSFNVNSFKKYITLDL